MIQSNDKQQEFHRIQTAIENFRQHDRSTCGVIFTDNWYDSHPRLLIFDPVLNPYDKLVWLAIRSFCSPDLSLSAFPSYDQIQSALHISRGAVASSIVKLRATRWLTLLCRETVRNQAGQITKDGNIYLVHGEPLGLSDTFKFDSEYMQFLQQCRNHRNSDVRKISELIINSIRDSMEHNDNVLKDNHPFDKRSEAWASISGESEAKFFGRLHPSTDTPIQPSPNPNHVLHNPNSTAVHQVDYSSRDSVVHEVDYGAREPVVHQVDYGKNKPVVHRVDYGTDKGNSSISGINSKSYNYNYKEVRDKIPSSDELTYPSSLSDNQKHLIELHLQRLPNSLPSPPRPWTSWSQLLLDELAGRIHIGDNSKCDSVWNPVSLMSAYCERLISKGLGLKSDGQFQIEHAESVHARRQERITTNKAYQDARNQYQRNIDRHIGNSHKDSTQA